MVNQLMSLTFNCFLFNNNIEEMSENESFHPCTSLASALLGILWSSTHSTLTMHFLSILHVSDFFQYWTYIITSSARLVCFCLTIKGTFVSTCYMLFDTLTMQHKLCYVQKIFTSKSTPLQLNLSWDRRPVQYQCMCINVVSSTSFGTCRYMSFIYNDHMWIDVCIWAY